MKIFDWLANNLELQTKIGIDGETLLYLVITCPIEDRTAWIGPVQINPFEKGMENA